MRINETHVAAASRYFNAYANAEAMIHGRRGKNAL